MENYDGMNAYKKRIFQAIHCEMPDKTPLGLSDSVLAKFSDPSYVQGDNYTRPEWAMDRLIEGAKISGTDIVPSFEYPAGLNFLLMDGTRFLTPGKEVPAGNGTQAEEHNYMSDPSHYDFIIENGWMAYYEKYIMPGLHEDDEAEFGRYMELNELFAQKCADARLEQYDIYADSGMANCGTYMLSMLRGYSNFLKDLRKIPDKVDAVAKIIMESEMESVKMMAGEGPVKWVYPSLARTDNTTMMPKTFAEHIWPEYLQYESMLKDTDGYMMIHIDGNYTGSADLFCQLRPKRTILQFDGFTDVLAIADKLAAHELCVWGDVPPQMMTMGTPEQVYEHCMELKKRLGPGLILACGCSAPPNSKLENLTAMKEAAENMHF